MRDIHLGIARSFRGQSTEEAADSRAEVRGACLDVFENEKPHTYTLQEKEMYSRLFAFPNVITSPHVAGWTQESLKRIADLVFQRIENGYSM